MRLLPFLTFATIPSAIGGPLGGGGFASHLVLSASSEEEGSVSHRTRDRRHTPYWETEVGAMYMSVRQYEKVSNTQELGRQSRENFEPLMSAVPGFVGYYITDAGGGTVFSTSIFETKANAEESNRVAAEWVGKHPSVLPPATRVTTGEVIGHKAK